MSEKTRQGVGWSRVMLGSFILMAIVFGGRSAWSAAPLEVFVSIPPQRYFVERVGGEYASVSVMVEPGRSPATYEPTPRQMSRLSRASLYFAIGVAFEDVWLTRIHAANPAIKIISLQENIPLREVEGVAEGGMPASKTRMSGPVRCWCSGWPTGFAMR